jgi:hypothetical protein
VTAVAAIAAWLGGSIVMFSDGRRGLALGVAVAAAGLGVLALSAGHGAAGAALLAGGGIAAVLCLRGTPEGWGVMPAGSTPRLILCIVTGLLALWIAAVITSGGDTGLRFAVPAVIGLAGLRVLLGAHQAAATAAASVTALALGAGTMLAADATPIAACAIAALVAAGLQTIPRPEADGA